MSAGAKSRGHNKCSSPWRVAALLALSLLVSCAGGRGGSGGDPPASVSRPPSSGGSSGGTGSGGGGTSGSGDTVPATYFGMHIHHLGDGTPWPTVPIGSYRLWDAGVVWSQVEPQRGAWDFTRMDYLVAQAQGHGVDLLYTFGPTSLWAASNPGELANDPNSSCSAPANLQDWDDYVRSVVKRYKGVIKEYEIWDEINVHHTYCGTAQEMVTLAKHAYAIIKSIDPSAIVLSPNVTVHTIWLDNFLAAGGVGSFDVVSFHFYTAYDLPGPTAAPPEGMLTHVNDLKKTMAKYNLSALPIWDTESGWWNLTFTQDKAAAFVARAYILLWAAGINREYWYSWDNHSFVSLHMTAPDSTTVLPSGIAYGEMQKWLVGATLNGCDSDATGTWTCQVIRGSLTSRIIWNQNGIVNFAVPDAWGAVQTQTDVLGKTTALADPHRLQAGPSPVLVQ